MLIIIIKIIVKIILALITIFAGLLTAFRILQYYEPKEEDPDEYKFPFLNITITILLVTMFIIM